jgi:hypothetical protein
MVVVRRYREVFAAAARARRFPPPKLMEIRAKSGPARQLRENVVRGTTARSAQRKQLMQRHFAARCGFVLMVRR